MIKRYLIAALLALWLAACGSDLPAGYTVEQQSSGDLRIALAHPQQGALLQEHIVFVTLSSADGTPIDGATVFLDLTMPGMEMGSNQPLAEPIGNGRYRATVLYTMEGEWQVAVHVVLAGKEHTAAFQQTIGST